MSAILKQALKQGAIAQAILAEIDHPEGFVRVWSGAGRLDYAGETYEGFGTLGRIETVADSTEPEIIEVRFVVSGVDPDLLEGLDDSVKGRRARVYEALLDRDFAVIERELLMDARLDYQVYAFGEDGTATIALIGHGGLFFLRNRSSAKWSPEEAKQRFPDESGFDEVHLAEDQAPVWKP